MSGAEARDDRETLPTSASNRLTLPGPIAILRHAFPNVLEGKIIPLVLFLGFLKVAGTTGALLTALLWSLGSIAYRVSTNRNVPALVVVSAIGLSVRTFLAFATGSMVVYFLQPTLSTTIMGLAFLVSVPMGRPLAERLAADFCPFEPETAAHPMLRVFFVRLSLLWSVTSLINGAITLWMLFTQSTTTFVLVKSLMGPTFTTATVLMGVLWFRGALRREGMQLCFSRSMAPQPAVVPVTA